MILLTTRREIYYYLKWYYYLPLTFRTNHTYITSRLLLKLRRQNKVVHSGEGCSLLSLLLFPAHLYPP